MILVSDVEADGFQPTKVHVICTKEYETGVKHSFTKMNEYVEYVEDVKPDKHCFHNGLAYDVKVINRLLQPDLINPKDVIDTMVVSKTVDYMKYRTHSLEEIGKDLGVHKGEYTGGFDVLTPEMITYCEQDVEVTEAILKKQMPFLKSENWRDALRTEHDIAWLCQEMNNTGFKFNSSLASNLLASVVKEMDELERDMVKTFKPKLVEVKRLKAKLKADGTYSHHVIKAIDEYPKVELEGDDFIVYDYKEFKPGSPKDRVDALWDAGWKPFEKTDGHIKHLRGKRTRWVK